MPTLKDILKAKHIRQADIMRKTGLSKSTISHACSGFPIQHTTIKLIAKEIGVAPEEIEGIEIYTAKGQNRTKKSSTHKC